MQLGSYRGGQIAKQRHSETANHTLITQVS